MLERIHPSLACESILSPLRESRANKMPSAPTGKESPLTRKNRESVPAVMEAELKALPRAGIWLLIVVHDDNLLF